MSLTYTYTQVHRCLCIHVCTCICVYMCTQTYIYKYVHMYIWPSSHTIIHEGEAFANKTWHILFLPFLNTGQEIPCSGTAKHTCQQHNTPFVSLLVTDALLDCLKTNQSSDLPHWPVPLPTGAKDLFMLTAITACINWPSESDLPALPLSESIRKSSCSAWLA